MKLTWLHIHRYRGVRPGSRLTFSPSCNVLVGENGTGRTLLLELIACVLASDFSGLVEEELSIEYGFELSGMTVWTAVRNEKRPAAAAAGGRGALLPLSGAAAAPELEPSVEMTFQLEGPATRMVMRLGAAGSAWEVDGRTVFSQSMRWSLLERPLWVLLSMLAHFLEPEPRARLQELLRKTLLLGPWRFDEALGTFDRIGAIRFALELREGEVLPFGLMALPRWLPGKLRERVAREPEAEVLEIRHDEVPGGFLARFVALAGFASARLRVELTEKRVFEDGERLEFSRFGFSFTRRDGSVLSQAHLGHGQKRLLSFLYYLDLNEDFAIADELTNGLHPRWIEACLKELGDRQAFLTSQNPLLFDALSLESVEDVRSSFILCRSELEEQRERLVWSSLDREAAEALFRAWQSGGGRAGELLRTLGVW